MAKATDASKEAVNLELKKVNETLPFTSVYARWMELDVRSRFQVLFQAHADGTINTTDWSKVELQSLVAFSILIRMTH